MLKWWEMLAPDDRSETQRFIADAARAYQNNTDSGASLAKRDCITKFRISATQYDWVLSYLTGCKLPNQHNQEEVCEHFLSANTHYELSK